MKTNKRITAWIVLVVGLVSACTPPPVPIAGSKTILDQPLANSVLLQSCTEAGCNLQPIDPGSGAALAGYAPLASGRSAFFAFAPNHSTLAMIAYPTNDPTTNGALKFVDLHTWQVQPTQLTFDGLNGAPLFSSDGQYLVVSGPQPIWPPGDMLQVIEVTRGISVANHLLDFTPIAMQFTADNTALMIYGIDKGPEKNGINPTAQVALFNVTNLSLLWQHALPDLLAGQYDPAGRTDPHVALWWHPATVFATNQAKLYLVHADANRLTTVDFERQTVATVDIIAKQSWLERLLALIAQPAYAKELNGTSKEAVLSPDGQYLYVAGVKRTYEKEVYNETPLPLQVIDVATHQVIAQPDVRGQEIAITPDGTRLFLHNWTNNTAGDLTEWTEVVTLPALHVQRRLAEQSVQPQRLLGGEPLLLVATRQPTGEQILATLDPDSLQPQQSWPAWEKGAWGWWVAP